MTLLQALKASIEFGYQNDDLFNKVLIDHNLTSVTTYAVAYKPQIDACLLDVYNILLTHPEIQDGRTRISFDKPSLKAAAMRIAQTYTLSTVTRISAGMGNPTNADPQW